VSWRHTEDERPTVHPNLSGTVGGVAEGAVVSHRILDLGPELERLQHRLLVLELVLQHEPEDESLPEQRAWPVEVGVLDRLEDPLANVGCVRSYGLRTKDRRLRPPVSLQAERVVYLAMRVGDRRLAVEVTEQPELLEVNDARAPRPAAAEAGRRAR